jgi:FAD:protein FMN transferase
VPATINYFLHLPLNPVNIVVLHRLFFLLAALFWLNGFSQQRYQYTQPKMGSPFRLVFYAIDSMQAARLATKAFSLVDSLNTLFSDYQENSELSCLNRTAGSGRFVPVSPLLYDVLSLSQTAATKSQQAYDITIGPLSRLWRTARKAKQFPPEAELQAAKAKVGSRNLVIDTATKKVSLRLAGMQLDLGGIAKGYVAQKVVDLLRFNGVASALADAGGDMACSDPPPGKKGWTVGINVPGSETELLAETIEISNSAVATSGDVYQYLEHNGKRYSHIIDPRTGYGVLFQRNVTVLAPDGATADWLATACSILPLRKGKKLVRQFGAQLLITQLKDDKITYFMTSEMRARVKK